MMPLRSEQRTEPQATVSISNGTWKRSCPLQIPLAPSFTRKTDENHLIDTSSIATKLISARHSKGIWDFLDAFVAFTGRRNASVFPWMRGLPGQQCRKSLLTWSARGFHLTFFSRAGAETRVFWGRFFKVKITPFGSSRKAFTRFFNCQPT